MMLTQYQEYVYQKTNELYIDPLQKLSSIDKYHSL